MPWYALLGKESKPRISPEFMFLFKDKARGRRAVMVNLESFGVFWARFRSKQLRGFLDKISVARGSGFQEERFW